MCALPNIWSSVGKSHVQVPTLCKQENSVCNLGAGGCRNQSVLLFSRNTGAECADSTAYELAELQCPVASY